ncbi:MAG: hypothetical protein RBG13Loki_2802 [Promethearchaeota archaeon CR_4]|nr:MAG: hypothetical protein RBG13Loki_2802 [Candidatus Lokiarchaeota archaeon CR_4]
MSVCIYYMMTVINKEIEPLIVLKDLVDQKKQLKSVLEKYNVDNPEQIEKKIQDGTIPEHPAYEDYLGALSFQHTIDEMKLLAKRLIEDF